MANGENRTFWVEVRLGGVKRSNNPVIKLVDTSAEADSDDTGLVHIYDCTVGPNRLVFHDSPVSVVNMPYRHSLRLSTVSVENLPEAGASEEDSRDLMLLQNGSQGLFFREGNLGRALVDLLDI